MNRTVRRAALVVLVVCLALIAWAVAGTLDAIAGEPDPPYVIVMPDGQRIPSALVQLHLFEHPKVVAVHEWPIHADGFESASP